MLADLSRWLAREGLGVRDLTAQRAELFVGDHRAAGYSTWVSSTCVALPLAYLREVGAVPPLVTVTPQGPWVQVLAGYHEYLVRGAISWMPGTFAAFRREPALRFGGFVIRPRDAACCRQTCAFASSPHAVQAECDDR
jgi:hypothetical protein